ncbi:MAG TPA: serine/threonine protein phosphatase [Thermoprotei archaeon]|nr:serine/threonine protein phosphatase [Thermoprotei archaeon]
MNIDDIIQRAASITRDDIDDLIQMMRNIIEDGFFSNVYIRGGVAYTDDIDTAYIFGDVHGDFDTLAKLVRMVPPGETLIFLGDILDRGGKQLEALYLILSLTKLYNVLILRGNHEPPEWLIPFPHDFPHHIKLKVGRDWRLVYKTFLNLFDQLPHAGVLNNEIFLVHGGIPVTAESLDDIENPNKNVLTEILWNDPFDGYGIRPSYRGVGYLFGEDVTRTFLMTTGLKAVVRGHEPVDGYKIMHGGRLVTIFSRLGEPYNNTKASIYLYKRGFRGFEDKDFISIGLSTHEKHL